MSRFEHLDEKFKQGRMRRQIEMIVRQLFLDRHTDVFLRVLQHRRKQTLLRTQRMRQRTGHVIHHRRSLLEFCGLAESRGGFRIGSHEWGGIMIEALAVAIYNWE